MALRWKEGAWNQDYRIKASFVSSAGALEAREDGALFHPGHPIYPDYPDSKPCKAATKYLQARRHKRPYNHH
jgi:hypothetical protein